jgi:glycosyltransferase involved in cell wall biosynthesis
MPDVSVIMPIYNMEAYLGECLKSVLSQHLKEFSLEVIAIDDGSTDRSGALLDDFAAEDPRLTVIHQENSGWPGQPRNRGIEHASGRYVFFCDADDLMPEESLHRLITFADKHGSDVVIPKVIGGNGRWIRRWLYEKTEIDADLYKAFLTHGPQKLFRRSLVMEHSVRFPEYKMRIEDAMFGFRCYTLASRVSILADYDYYILQNRHDGSNISRAGLDPVNYTRDTVQVAKIIHDGLPEGELRDRILAELYRRLCIRRYIGSSFADAPVERQEAWIRGHQEFVGAFVPPSLDALLDPVNRQRSMLIRTGRRDDLVVMAASTADDRLWAGMGSITPTEAGCAIEGRVRVENQFRMLSWAVLELKRRGGAEEISFNVYPRLLEVPEDGRGDLPKHMEFRVELAHEALRNYPHGTYNVVLRTVLDGKPLSCRLTSPSGDATVHYPATDEVHFYATRHGNLSCVI